MSPSFHFSLVSYNILSQTYLEPRWYPQVPPALLLAAPRRAAVLGRVAGLGADVLCLQEVDPDVFADLQHRLAALGYAGHYAQKTRKPDGCATFVKTEILTVLASETLRYQDGAGGPDSGHVALLLTLAPLAAPARRVVVANTHLRWQPVDTPPADRVARRQLAELLEARARRHDEGSSWILCGDFNLIPDSPVLAPLREAGLRESHAAPHRPTCHANGVARTVDYLWHDATLAALPMALRPLADDTPLPSADEPSDHLPLGAHFDFVTR